MDPGDDAFGAVEDSSGTSFDTTSQETICRIYKAFLLEHNMPEIIRILLEDEVNMHYSIVTDCTTLLKLDKTLVNLLFFYSDKALDVLDTALAITCSKVYETHALKLQMTLKPNLHARIKNIPVCPELWRERVPKSRDISKFLAVEGTVIRTSSVKLLEYEKELVCSKCQNAFAWKADLTQHYRIAAPLRCPVHQSCNSKKFVMAQNGCSRKCKDFQEIKIQEQLRRLAMGTIPRVITVVLEDDLVDGCKAGDDVVIYGAVKCRWQPLQKGKPCDIELILKANYIEVRNEQRLGASVKEEMQNDFECFWAAHAETPLTARNHIVASLCPQIYGSYVVKLAVALVLAGGVPRTDSSGSRVRGEAHLLLVGDPGTGKSQLLKYAAKITPRSVLTTGIGSTSAGLTVTAIRDGPHWSLEAGALVLADGGICCIDEFSSIKEHDRGAIHEAMEQQTVSVAKAGLVCKLNTRTSILAATNSKLGKYDESLSVDLNVAIATPLLSRFDIVLVLLDEKNELWDSVVADYILTGKGMASNGERNLWTMERMQAYFCVVKQINPVLSPAANRILSEYYRCHRRSDYRNAARTTIRLLESLIRIAEAHARLRYTTTVEVLDAVAAIQIMESSMQCASLLPNSSVLHSCFPTDVEQEYETYSRQMLNRLGLGDILNGENTNMPANNSSFVSPGFLIKSEAPLTSTGETSLTELLPKQNFGPGSSAGSTPRVLTTSRWTNDFTFENFEKSINFHHIFDKSCSSGHKNVKTSTQDCPPVEVAKSAEKSISQSDFRNRLQCFRHETLDSSPERDFQLTGIIKRGNRKEHNSSAEMNFPSNAQVNEGPSTSRTLFSPSKSPFFEASTQNTSVSVDFDNEEPSASGICKNSGKRNVESIFIGAGSPCRKKSVFSLDSSFDFDDVMSDFTTRDVTTSKTLCPPPVMGKHSVFTLNASAIEDICAELASDNDSGNTGNDFLPLRDLLGSQRVVDHASKNRSSDARAGLPASGSDFLAQCGLTDSQCVISVPAKNPLDGARVKSADDKENDPPVQAMMASTLFRIEEDFEDGGEGGTDFFGFNMDWSANQSNSTTKKRKTFEL